jgi:hypothetical protein
MNVNDIKANAVLSEAALSAPLESFESHLSLFNNGCLIGSLFIEGLQSRFATSFTSSFALGMVGSGLLSSSGFSPNLKTVYLRWVFYHFWVPKHLISI